MNPNNAVKGSWRLLSSKTTARWAKSLILISILCLLAAGARLQAQTNDSPQIRFLRVRLKGQTVSLIDSAVRPGTLKPKPGGAADDLEYELVTQDGAFLWKSSLPDPSTRHLEYEDPPGSGSLQRKTVVLPEVEFTIRVPVLPAARQVNVYRLEPQQAAGTVTKSAARKLLGSLSLP